MTARTPGPWRVHDVNPDVWTRQVWTDESHGSVMIATTGGIDKDANAAFIVEACNAHDSLLAQRDSLAEALRDVTAWFRSVPGAMTNGELLLAGCPNDLAATIDKARAALALVDGAR